jgi:hypothetical protein
MNKYLNSFLIYILHFRTALEVAVLLKEHPGYMCPMLTLVQEYQSR